MTIAKVSPARLREGARWWLVRGFAAFQTRNRAAGKGWADDDPDELYSQLATNDDLEQIAVRMGTRADGRVAIAIDIDCKNGKDGYASFAELEAELGPLPPTLTQSTPSGGKHLILWWPVAAYDAEHPHCSTSKLGSGVDIKGHRGYICAAPSQAPKPDGSMGQYERTDHEIADLPLEWAAAIVAIKDMPHEEREAEPVAKRPPPIGARRAGQERYAQRLLDQKVEEIAGSGQGSRNTTLNACSYRIGRLVGAGLLARDYAFRALRDAGLKSGMSRSEVPATVRSGLNSGARKPIVFRDEHGPWDEKREEHPVDDDIERAAIQSEPSSGPPSDPPPTPPEASFPMGVLGPELAAYARALAENLLLPDDMAAVAMIGVLMVCAQRHFSVEIREGWEEPCVAHVQLFAPPGYGKSPLFRELCRPIWEAQKKYKEAHEDQRLNLVDSIAELQGQPGSAAQVEMLQRKLADLKPAREIALSGDSTTEMTIRVAAEQDGSVAFLSAECFPPALFGAYKQAGSAAQSADLNLLLEGHDGGRYSYRRVTGNVRIDIDRARLGYCCSTQYANINALESGLVRDRGATGRMLIYVAPPAMQSDEWEQPPVPRHLTQAWESAIGELLSHECSVVLGVMAGAPDTIPITDPGATEAVPRRWIDILRRSTRREVVAHGKLALIGDWGTKIAGRMARISAVLSYLARQRGETLDPGDMLQLAEFFTGHATRALSGLRAQGPRTLDPAREDVELLVAVHDGAAKDGWCRLRDARRLLPASLRRDPWPRDAMDRAEDAGLLETRALDVPAHRRNKPPFACRLTDAGAGRVAELKGAEWLSQASQRLSQRKS